MARVGPMDSRVAQGACLILLRLVMEGRNGGRALVRRKRMAVQAKQVHVRPREQPWIRRSVRGMTTHAALHLDRFMLVHERPGLVAVTFETARILR